MNNDIFTVSKCGKNWFCSHYVGQGSKFKLILSTVEFPLKVNLHCKTQNLSYVIIHDGCKNNI